MNHRDTRKTLVFRNSKAMTDCAVNKWIEISTTSVAEQGYFAVALSGGKTPLDFYRKLSACKRPLPWDKTHIFFADERFVPLDDKESNYRLIQKYLLSHITIPEENVHPIPTDEDRLELSAKEYEDDLRTFFALNKDALPAFDLIMLGIGEDGHTASLFPGASSLRETERLAIPVITDRSPSERISLTLPVINNAKNIFFLVKGKKKAGMIKALLQGSASSLPAAQVKPARGTIFFLMDQEAASLLADKGEGILT
jgi:6-phosphogluconolactonase